MKPNPRFIVIALLVAALGVASWYWLGRRDRREANVIRVSGNIELTEVNVAFKAPGKLVELVVREGDPVERGKVVARLDQEQLLRQRDRARAAVTAAESRLAQLATAIDFQRETVEGQIEQRRAEWKQAEAVLEQLLAGSRPQEIEQARAAVAAARTEFDRARKDWERAQDLHKNEDISTAEFDRFRARHESAGAALKQAEERLALVVEGPRKEDIAAARAQVDRARAALRLAEAARIDLRIIEQEPVTRRAEIEQARAQLAEIESRLGDTVAASSIDGVVLVKAAEVGEVLAAGSTVVTVGDQDRPWLRAYIGEQDLGRVKLGAKVKVTTDSFPGKVYWGRLTFIASEAEFTPKQIQTAEERVKLVYRVKIEVENPGHELKSNMPADAEIQL